MRKTPSPAEALAAAKSPRTVKQKKSSGRPVIFPNVRLLKMRVYLGLTQTEVAAAAGVLQITVSAAEQGLGISLQTALKLAAFYGCYVEELWPA